MGGIQTFFVPFDGTDLAVTALEQAETLASGTDADLVVATIVPKDRDYALERGWLTPGEALDADAIEERLLGWVTDVAPTAEFRFQAVGAHVSSGGIATRIRDTAMEIGADVVFLGSENVGSVAAPVSSIGSNVASRVSYDIYLVQSR
jgi:nucleotide-binding universal stress UspA family protein